RDGHVTGVQTCALPIFHTRTAASTVDRLIDVFPPEQQSQIRTMLADTLKGVIAQQLLVRADSQGRVVAVEILVGTTALANLIRRSEERRVGKEWESMWV